MAKLANPDEAILLWLNGQAGRFPPLDRAMQLLVSDYLVPVGMALIVLALWFSAPDRATRMKQQIGVFAALTALGLSSLAVFVINSVYFRPRPFVNHDLTLLFYQPTDSSFPANSVAAAFGLATVVWSVNRPVGISLLLAAFAWGFARVYSGVHYPSDVLAAAAIGIVAGILVLRLRDLLGPIPVWVIKAARLICLA